MAARSGQDACGWPGAVVSPRGFSTPPHYPCARESAQVSTISRLGQPISTLAFGRGALRARRPDLMANFTTHIAVGTVVSGALATVTVAADVVAPENIVAVTLAGVLGS